MDKKIKITPRMLKQTDEPMTYAAMVAMPKFEGDDRGGSFLLDAAHYHTILFEKNDIGKIIGHAEQSQITLKNGTRLYFGCDVQDLHQMIYAPTDISQANLVDLCEHGLLNDYKDQKMTISDVCNLVNIHDPALEEYSYIVKFIKYQYQVTNQIMHLEEKAEVNKDKNKFRIHGTQQLNLPIQEQEFELIKQAAAIMQVQKLNYTARISAADAYLKEHKAMPGLEETLADKPKMPKPPKPPRPRRTGGTLIIGP